MEAILRPYLGKFVVIFLDDNTESVSSALSFIQCEGASVAIVRYTSAVDASLFERSQHT